MHSYESTEMFKTSGWLSRKVSRRSAKSTAPSSLGHCWPPSPTYLNEYETLALDLLLVFENTVLSLAFTLVLPSPIVA